jgi:hydroxymethylpyrimidine pyrophosphatase-like HAD family hydrolase
MQKGKAITTLNEFYYLLKKNRITKQKVLSLVLENRKIPEKYLNYLKNSYKILNNIKKQNNKFILNNNNQKIKTSLNYELSELEKDIIYLEKGEDILLEYFSHLHKDFLKQKNNLKNKLKYKKIDLFITDRDGTINNYSERYLSSIQSIYNAVFISRFISNKSYNSIILTSASLNDFKKVNIIPSKFLKKNNVILAGSKGSEFIYDKKVKMPITQKQKIKLNTLEKEIKKILYQKKYRIFSIIGSGFQIKHGQLTIAIQDISNSINKTLSKEFSNHINQLVKKIDTKTDYFTINNTGTDIEITLNFNNKIFDKSKGVKFILDNLNIEAKNTLVCGDTSSDLDFFNYMKNKIKNFNSIFVSNDSKLKNKIKKYFPKTIFISSPDILITALNDLSKKNEA